MASVNEHQISSYVHINQPLGYSGNTGHPWSPSWSWAESVDRRRLSKKLRMPDGSRSNAKHTLTLRLLPATELNSESNSQLGELEHMLEAELVRDVVFATGNADVSAHRYIRISEFAYSSWVWMCPWFEFSKVASERM